MNKKLNSSPILLTPGPVMLIPPVLSALSEQTIHHRSTEFSKLFLQVSAHLKKIFQTKQPVLMLNASGTGAMSAALLNTLSPKDKVLAICAGRFGQRWADMASAYQLQVQKLNIPWGESVKAQQVKTILKKDPQIKAVLTQACETSTGALHPIQKLAQLTHTNPKVLLIVDAISALGAVNIPMDQWGIDVLIGGSQKSFSLPTGMSFICLSKKAWQFNKTAHLPVYYLDLKKEKAAQKKGQTAFSSNVSYIKALYQFFLSGAGHLSTRIQHSRKMSQLTSKFCKNLGLKTFAKVPSPSMTSITLPPHIDGMKLKKYIETKYAVTFAGGQGILKGRVLRIGHLGNESLSHLIKGLTALVFSLKSTDKNLWTNQQIKHALKKLQQAAKNK